MAMLKPITPRNGTVNVSFPDYGETKEIEVNFEDLKTKEIIQVGEIHPDLSTQADHAVKDIEYIKNRILKRAMELIELEGTGIISMQLDSIYNYLAMERQNMKDRGEFTQEDFTDIVGNVYTSIEITKKLLDLYLSKENMEQRVQCLEYAQKGVLT